MLGDQRENDVFDGHARTQRPVQAHAHALLLALAQRLRREDAFALAGADAERNGPKRAVGAGVAVAADKGDAGQREPEFGPDDVDDPVTVVLHTGCS